MRLLLASNALYYPAHGGGERSNRMVMEGLAQRGHECLVLTRTDRLAHVSINELMAQLEQRGVSASCEGAVVRYMLNQVAVRVAAAVTNLRSFFLEEAKTFRPDVILCSTDDPAQILLQAALDYGSAKVVFLTRATIALPFGPDAAFVSPGKARVLSQVDGHVGVSNYVAGYIREYGGYEAVHVPIAPPEPGPYAMLGNFDNEFVAMVNPCAVKGLSIFVELARAFPNVRFAGVPTWGATPEDLALLRAQPNITVLPKVDHIADLLRRVRVLLVPSVWAEARSRIVVEAMLAGVPVIASNLGGLPEAKMGVPYILPVNPLTGYRPQLNEQFVPVAQVPPQDVTPWREALDRLLTDPEHWRDISKRSREAALHYAETANVEGLEQYLAQLEKRPRQKQGAMEMPLDQLSKLSPERRKLLELKLRKPAAAESKALPFGAGNREVPRLFCFPHAGGSAGFFRGWRSALADIADVAPVQYPGHETRHAEALPTSMDELVSGLAQELKPELGGRFAFFGHSMGGIVAFELARKLRHEGLPLPATILVSSTRSPIYRLHHKPGPDPTKEELLAEVSRLGGLPTEVLANERLLRLVAPVLTADTKLYRRYVYEPGEPLSIPIVALGGEDDPNIQVEHLANWQQVTSLPIHRRRFPGGHFYMASGQDALLSYMRDVCKEIAAESAKPSR